MSSSDAEPKTIKEAIWAGLIAGIGGGIAHLLIEGLKSTGPMICEEITQGIINKTKDIFNRSKLDEQSFQEMVLHQLNNREGIYTMVRAKIISDIREDFRSHIYFEHMEKMLNFLDHSSLCVDF